MDTTEEQKRVTNPHIKLVVLEESEYWSEAVRKRAGRLFATYMFDANEETFCAEITPSYYLHHLYTTPTQNGDDDDLDELIRMEEAGSDNNRYMHCRTIDGMPTTHFHDGGEEVIPNGDTYDQYIDSQLEYYNGNVCLQVPAGLNESETGTHKGRCANLIERITARDGEGNELQAEFNTVQRKVGGAPNDPAWQQLLLGAFNAMPIEDGENQINMAEALRQGRVFVLDGQNRGYFPSHTCPYAVPDNWAAASGLSLPNQLNAMWLVNGLGVKAEMTLPNVGYINREEVRELTEAEYAALAEQYGIGAAALSAGDAPAATPSNDSGPEMQ